MKGARRPVLGVVSFRYALQRGLEYMNRQITAPVHQSPGCAAGSVTQIAHEGSTLYDTWLSDIIIGIRHLAYLH